MKTKSIILSLVAILSATFLFAQTPATKPAPAKQPAKTTPGAPKPEAKPVVTPVQVAPTTPAPAASAAENPNAPDFKFETEEHNFGNINQGDVVNYDFKFTNGGKEPLIISNATGSCGCTVPDYPKDPIKPGASAVIKVTFNSAGKSGMQDKTVTINSNAKTPQKVIHIKGNVTAPPPTPAANPATPPTPAPAPAKH